MSFKNAFSSLQKIGKCMMLPVSVLPVAGILLGVGSANFSWLPHIVSQVMAQSGGAIFSNLPLLFAIGVAIGLTENDGVSALAGTVGWFVFLAAMGVCAKARGIETTPIMGIPSIETGVFGGIIVGLVAAHAFNRFYKIQLPSYLGFFAGKRSGTDHHRVRSDHRRRAAQLHLAADRQWHQSVFELGRTRPTRARFHHLWRGRAIADSIRTAPRLERAVLFPGRRFPRPDHRQRSSRRDHALYRRRSDGGKYDRRLPFQNVGTPGRRARDLAQRRVRRIE